MFTSGLVFLWNNKRVFDWILQSISGNGERIFFSFKFNEVDALHLKFINVVKTIPGKNTGAVFP